MRLSLEQVFARMPPCGNGLIPICNWKKAYGRLAPSINFMSLEGLLMKYRKQVHYVKGVFACPKCHQHFVQEKWLEEFRVRCHKCDYRGALTHVSVEEQMDEEIERR